MLTALRSVSRLAAAAALVAALSACSDSARTPVPKPDAWPRINTYSADYRTLDSLGVCLSVNAGADVTVKSTGVNAAADIAYPRYGAVVYVLVLNNVADIRAEVAGRRERMARNLGDTPAESTPFAAADSAFTGMVVTARSVSQTPVQLVAVDASGRRLVSATAFFSRPVPASALDSIRPVVSALSRDMLAMAKSLAVCSR